MSIAERPSPTEPQTLLIDEAPQSLASALAPVRSRVLLRLFLRWYWVGALATDIVALVVLLVAKPYFSSATRLISSVCLLAIPIIAAAIRCLAVRLPLPQLAQLTDSRGGLQERVASAVDASASSLASPRMLALLTRDALTALRAIDLPVIFPLKRDTALAAVALAATFALWFWHAPHVFGFALPGKQSQSSAFQEMTGERHLVTVPAKSNPTAAPKPSATPPKTKPTASTPTQPRPTPQSSGSHASPGHPSTSPSQNKNSAQSPGGGNPQPSQTPAGAPTAGNNTQPAASAKTGGSAPAHADASHSPAQRQQQTSRQGAHAPGAANHSAHSPGQQTSRSSIAPKPRRQSGTGNRRQGNSGQQGSANKSNPSGAKSGKPSSTNSPKPQSKSGGQAGQGQKTGQQPQGKGQGSQPSKANGSPQNGNPAHPANSSKGDLSGQNQNRANAPTHPNSPFATGGHGKPLPIQPRDLPTVANRSHFSFRLPKASGGGLKEVPTSHSQRPSFRPGAAGANGSTVPFGDGQAATSLSPGAPDPSDVEQNPRIPVAYRNLVKQYFSNGSGRAH